METVYPCDRSVNCELLFLLAQGDRGAVTGVVVDSSGSAIPDVTLEIVNTGTNAKFDTVSTGTGAYRLVGLPVGIYDLTAKANGFTTFIQRGIQIQTNQTATVNITLNVGAVTRKRNSTRRPYR